jgi:hypothetical protein
VGAPNDTQGNADALARGAAYVFVRSGTAWTRQARLVAGDQVGDGFGTTVAIAGDTVIAGAPLNDFPAGSVSNQGAAYVFVRSGTTWNQQQKLTASDAAIEDQLGTSVAVVGDTALVSARLDDFGMGASLQQNQGSAYVFRRNGSAWAETQKLSSFDGVAQDQFGWSAGLSGSTAIVGAPFDDLEGKTDQGSAHIFILEGGPTPTPTPTPSPSPSPIPSPSPSPAPMWEAVVLTVDQVEIKTWTFQSRPYAYLKLLFPNAGYRVANWGQAVRAGNDFAADASVEKFAGASVQAVTTTAQIYDLGPLAAGNYTFSFKNSGTVAKSLMFTVNSATPPPNPIDTAREFVKQQYRDFLNREADQAGEDFWTDNIAKCSDPARRPAGQTVEQCTLRQRETTSGAFFLSPEFQYTGYFVYRMYQGGLGRQPKLSEFIPDAQFVGNGIVVNGQLSAAKINQNKADYAQQFVNCTDPAKYRCAEFKAIYDGLSNQQYVDKLFLTTGVNASASDRAALINGLNGATETRASVLQKVVDGVTVLGEGNQQFATTYGQAFYNSEFNRAFVQLEYFGYMKRDPDEAGYAFWLGKLNQFGGNFVNAEMVLAFISSPEYRARFGQP